MQELKCLCMTVPLPGSLRFLRPFCLLLGDSRFKEMVAGLGGVLRDGACRSCVCDVAQILVNLADYASFFPRLSSSSNCSRGLIQFPTALGQNPAIPAGGLNEKNFSFIG